MNNLRQAAKQTLERYRPSMSGDVLHSWATDAQAEIDALRAALAEQPAEQEPLFWYRPRGDGLYEWPIHDAKIERVRKESGGWVPLFTKPQPRREVELTDDAITHMAAQSLLYEETPPQGFDAAVRSFARAVIAAYKEKNK